MKIIQTLICFGLRHVAGEAVADTAGKGVEFLVAHFTDSSQALPKAIVAANERTWKALAVALAGDSLWEQGKRLFGADQTTRSIRVQVEPFLRAAAMDRLPKEFREACLADLKKLRGSAEFKAGGLPAADFKRGLTNWQTYGDPLGVVDGACKAVNAVALALEEQYPKLSRLLRQRAGDAPPLLASLFAFFLREEIAKDKDLSAALTFDLLRNLYAAQETAFAGVGQALDAIGDKLDAILDQLGRIEEKVGETHDLAAKMYAMVLDIQAELQRDNGEEMRRLHVEVISKLEQLGMKRGALRLGDSCSIRGEGERNAVRALLRRFRQLPAEQQHEVPALLNGLVKLQVAAGDKEEARRTNAEVAAAVPVAAVAARAEVCFNDYRIALEQKDFDGALVAIQAAIKLDPARFSLFPKHRYTAQRILGAGGFGAAFLCYDKHLKREVVVKTLHAENLERNVEVVFNEALALSSLSHQGIIGVRDCDYAYIDSITEKPERPYIVMDYFAGVSLQAYVEKNGALKLGEYLAVATQIVAAMQAAHEQGVWHRDLKPDNILILREGDRFLIKIIDFGLALRRDVAETSVPRMGVEPTILGKSAAGTFMYSPMEQMNPRLGIEVGPQSDVYAFGKTSWFLLFKTTVPQEAQKQKVPILAGWLDRCTKEHPLDRPASFDAVARHLDDARPPDKESPPQRRRRNQERETAHARQREATGRVAEAATELEKLSADRGETTRYQALCQHRDEAARGDKIVAAEPPKPFTNSHGIQFVLVPSATFWMGERGSQRQVEIPHHCYFGIHTVTQGQWQALMGHNPSWFSRTGGGADKVRRVSDAKLKQFPVEQVSWEDAQAFIEKLNDREGDREWVYRLPTEAEWEYVCRGGAISQDDCSFDFYFDKPTNDASSREANFNGNHPYGNASKGPHLERTTKVGSFMPNRLGVYDMHGNVWEWCNDVAEPGASARVIRGGSWYDYSQSCVAAYRIRDSSSYRSINVGFRLARVPSGSVAPGA